MNPVADRIAFLLNCIGLNAPLCPDPSEGGCMGSYCTRCALRELYPTLERLLGAPLPAVADPSAAEERVKLLPVTPLECKVWLTTFSVGFRSHRDREEAVWEAYAAVMAFRGAEPSFHKRHPAVLAMCQEVRRTA